MTLKPINQSRIIKACFTWSNVFKGRFLWEHSNINIYICILYMRVLVIMSFEYARAHEEPIRFIPLGVVYSETAVRSLILIKRRFYCVFIGDLHALRFGKLGESCRITVYSINIPSLLVVTNTRHIHKEGNSDAPTCFSNYSHSTTYQHWQKMDSNLCRIQQKVQIKYKVFRKVMTFYQRGYKK